MKTQRVDLRDDGLLWLINRVVFHPRGFGLAMVIDDAGSCLGWQLQGDGTEPWSFPVDDEPVLFAAAQRLLAPEAVPDRG